MGRKRSSISQLEEMVWVECVIEKPSRDKEALERWQRDEFAHLTERFSILPLPAGLACLLDVALDEWRERESKTFRKMGVERDEFMEEFKKAREDLLAGGRNWMVFALRFGPAAMGAVLNMDWVNLFSWILPLADVSRTSMLREIGRVVVALFYTELMFKHIGEPDSRYLRAIEARWKLLDIKGPF